MPGQFDLPKANAPYTRQSPATYKTELTPMEEQLFQAWVVQNKVPLDEGPQADYDMRGFFRALLSGDPRAKSAIDPNDSRMHYPDFWKTPQHETFSRESQWALPRSPEWNEQDQLVSPGGRVVFDDRKKSFINQGE
jgi:hypothetical protein